VRPLAALCAAILALSLPGVALAGEAAWCAGPTGTTAIVPPLERTTARIEAGGPLRIIAIGSSSTVGVGASGPDETYPAQLQAALRRHFPGLDIEVANRGKSGEDAPEELARLAADVVTPHPDLAIWQVGTNAVLRRDDLSADGERIREGIAVMKSAGIDVVLMDLQDAPRVVERPSYARMEDLIADAANELHVGLFRRFALMRYWQIIRSAEVPAMVGPDGLHMTDAGYGCLANDLATALETNWRASQKLARGAHGRGDAIAGLIGEPADKAATARSAPGMRRIDAKPVN
jgi:lysophospholipase L1-like esterase